MGTYFEELYNDSISKALIKKYSINNPHCVPKVDKVVVCAGLGSNGNDKKIFDGVRDELSRITGRRPCYRKSRAAIAGFNLKENQIVGVHVTLRRKVMYEFLERLVYLSLPRIHDFRGFSKKSFDKHNNFAFGISDHLIFSELSYDTVVANRGLNIMISIKNADSVEKACDLLRGFNFPLR